MPVPVVMFLHALPAILTAAVAGLIVWGVFRLGRRAYGKLAHN